MSSEEFAKRLTHSNIESDYIFYFINQLGEEKGKNCLHTDKIKYSVYAQKWENKVHIYVGLDGIVDDDVKIIFTGYEDEVFNFLLDTYKNME